MKNHVCINQSSVTSNAPPVTSLPRQRLSVILASAATAGAIAAVRQLDSHGFDVSVITSRRLSAAAWSRRVSHSYVAPAESKNQRFLERLMTIGASHPGRILLPTSDETAWLYTQHADELGKHFQLYQPSITCMRRILDKKLLAHAAVSAGLSVLPSWDPRNLSELAAMAPTLPYPILIKPRTHVHRRQNDKGIVVHSKSDIIEQYERFVRIEQRNDMHNPLMPDARRPILQQFVKVASEGVCSITGFIDRTGKLFVTRRSTKVFLRSQPVGVGVCFESLPADPVLSNAVRDLCLELGYYGIFEVEFLRFNGGWAVIDFNPRLYHQIGLDIHRGMPLPSLACLDAAGDSSALRDAVTQAQKEGESSAVFCDQFTLRMILLVRKLTARISPAELAYWRNWMKRNAGQCVDVAADSVDVMPGIIYAFSEVCLGLKALRRFLRLTPRASSTSILAGKRAQ